MSIACIVFFMICSSLNIMASEGIICWTCGHENYVDCFRKGYFQECFSPGAQHACSTKIVRNGPNVFIQKGCKQRDACIAERRQNWNFPAQCNGRKLQSTCRCCCFDDFCNKNELCQYERRSSCRSIPRMLNNGTVSCTDGNNVGSNCTFRCPFKNSGNPITLIPPYSNRITCLPNGKWNKPIPNCREPCPRYLPIDLIVIIHRQNKEDALRAARRAWIGASRVVDFERNSFRYAGFYYRSRVHGPHLDFTETALTNTTEFFNTAINLTVDETDDGPMNTGAALWYVYRNIVRTEGDRPNVPNILIVNTDTASADDVIAPARALRELGVKIFARGTRNTDNQNPFPITKSELESIAGYRSNWNLGMSRYERVILELDIYCRSAYPTIV